VGRYGPGPDVPTDGSRIVKLYVDLAGKRFEVSREAELPWSQVKDGKQRSGVAFRAVELKPAAAVKAA
jgi:hypothetical protein